MSLTSVCVRRPIGTFMFYLGVLLLGAISLRQLAVNLLPDLSYPKLSVLTEYVGAGPEEVESFVTTPLEAAVSSVSGIRRVNSISREGLSLVTLEFHWGTHMDFALLHTKEKVEETRRFLPEDCGHPIILEWDPGSAPIIISVIEGRDMTRKDLREMADLVIKPRLEQLEGVAAVETAGGDEEEISVEIDPEKIKNLGITISDVVEAIRRNNVSVSGGHIRKDNLLFTLKIEGEVAGPEQIEKLTLSWFPGRQVQVGDVGRAFFKNKIRQGDIRLDGRPVIGLMVYGVPGGNTVAATKAVEKVFSDLLQEFPVISVTLVRQEAEMINSAIGSLQSSLYLGSILAFFVLLLFLQNLRDPLFISTVIPIAVIGTFVLMFFAGVNVNIMSLGGLVLGLGMFVDNSIVVLESIHRHRQLGKSTLEAVITGSRDVAGAITASTLTTISIFLPVIYLYGVTGRLFRDQALTVSFSLLASLFVALSLLPAMAVFRESLRPLAAENFEAEKKSRRHPLSYPILALNWLLTAPFRLLGWSIEKIALGLKLLLAFLVRLVSVPIRLVFKPVFYLFNRFYDAFDLLYHRILEGFLNRKRRAVYLVLALLIAAFGLYSGLKKELLPVPQTAKFEIEAHSSPAYGFTETDRIAAVIENKLSALPGVRQVFAEVGAAFKLAADEEGFSINRMRFIVTCRHSHDRDQVMDAARALLEQSELESYSVFREKNTLSQYLGGGVDNFQLKVFYESLGEGRRAVTEILEVLRLSTNMDDLKANSGSGKPVFQLRFRESVLAGLNVSKRMLAYYINQAVRGEKAGTLQRVQRSLDIFVRVPQSDERELQELLDLPVNVAGRSLYLRDLVELQEMPSIAEIARESQGRYFLISANVPARDLPAVIERSSAALEELQLPVGTRVVFSGEEEERRRAFSHMQQAILLSILLVYMVMAAQFESLMHPFIIMLTVPMGMVGGFLLLFLTGSSLNIISGIGLMVMVGIGVNDAIVKVSYCNQLIRQEKMPLRAAVIETSRVRLRPILMTSMTTICGLLPMALKSSPGSELQRPLALVIIGGLVFTTVMSLLLIPVLYEFLESRRSE